LVLLYGVSMKAFSGRAILALALGSTIMLLGMAPSAVATEYQLGAQDKLKIKVYDWRPATNDTHEWTAVTGEFVVGAGGVLSLPIVGELNVTRSTTADVAQMLADRLQNKLGLAQPPFASVEVKQYRPFYIVGFVEKPGEYAFRPGLTVLQAVGISGGLQRTDQNSLAFERDALVSKGDLRALVSERLQLLVRQARLKATIDDSDKITLPPEINARKSEEEIGRIISEETQLLETYQKSLSSQQAVVQLSQSLLQQEIKSLVAKEGMLARQYDLTKKELDAISSLVSKGLAVAPRQVALEQNLAQFESSRLDVQLAQLRAQQEIARAEREGLEFRNKARSLALTEVSDVRVRLAALAERIKTASALVYRAEVHGPEEINQKIVPTYVVVRANKDGASVSQAVQENDIVLPGDTIRVDRPREPGPTLNAKSE
jgi:protein involved in polysaccharide export with SLBB domain